MLRRAFLSSFIATAGLIKVFGVKQLSETFRSKAAHLKSGDVVIAVSGGHFNLPANPVDGDRIQVIVENSTLHNPCIIHNSSARIAGDSDPLILDTIANFRLVYKSQMNDWVIT